ncbi:hypothetical protein M5K25_006761 [Dendrobium thyrsiflorum]|uniref:Uncharacterized protein n=1 Tax=Dendrobium thyrsiflorum TaxID=117978 RepID=A0ABD0VJN3_DENTH
MDACGSLSSPRRVKKDVDWYSSITRMVRKDVVLCHHQEGDKGRDYLSLLSSSLPSLLSILINKLSSHQTNMLVKSDKRNVSNLLPIGASILSIALIEDKLSKEEGRDCKDLSHLNSSSQREDLTVRNHCSASFGNETSSSLFLIISFFKEAILLNGSISNTDGSLKRRSLSMRWQLLVFSTSRYVPREIRLGQYTIVKYLSAASLAIPTARGRDVMLGQLQTSNVSRGIGFELLQKFKVVNPMLYIFNFLSLEGKEDNSFNFGQFFSTSSIKQGNKHPSPAVTPASNQFSNAFNPQIYNSSSNGKAWDLSFPLNLLSSHFTFGINEAEEPCCSDTMRELELEKKNGGAKLPYPFAESRVLIANLCLLSGKDDSLDLGVVFSQAFQLLHARLSSDLLFHVIRASVDDLVHDSNNKPFRHGSDYRGRESRTTEQ